MYTLTCMHVYCMVHQVGVVCLHSLPSPPLPPIPSTPSPPLHSLYLHSLTSPSHSLCLHSLTSSSPLTLPLPPLPHLTSHSLCLHSLPSPPLPLPLLPPLPSTPSASTPSHPLHFLCLHSLPAPSHSLYMLPSVNNEFEESIHSCTKLIIKINAAQKLHVCKHGNISSCCMLAKVAQHGNIHQRPSSAKEVTIARQHSSKTIIC